MAGWPTWVRAATLLGLAFLAWISSFSLGAFTASTVVLVGCLAVWLGLAVWAVRGGRRALFCATVSLLLTPAALIGVQFAGPACGIRPFGPEVRTREGDERLLPVPHEVCKVTLADGTRVTDGGPSRQFFIAFGWAVLATGLVLARRPGLLARAGLVVATWLLAAFALFA